MHVRLCYDMIRNNTIALAVRSLIKMAVTIESREAKFA